MSFFMDCCNGEEYVRFEFPFGTFENGLDRPSDFEWQELNLCYRAQYGDLEVK